MTKLIGSLYSGDVDAVVPVTGTRYGVEHMNLRKKEEWFSWYVNGQVSNQISQISCQILWTFL